MSKCILTVAPCHLESDDEAKQNNHDDHDKPNDNRGEAGAHSLPPLTMWVPAVDHLTFLNSFLVRKIRDANNCPYDMCEN